MRIQCLIPASISEIQHYWILHDKKEGKTDTMTKQEELE